MITGMYKNIDFKVNGEMSDEEIAATIQQFKESHHGIEFTSFEFTVDGDYLDVNYTFNSEPFERIRRITGYLVGTLDRFNDSKRTEVEDRVKHSLETHTDLIWH